MSSVTGQCCPWGSASHCLSSGVEGLSLDVSCLVDIRDHINKELALRFSTDIESDDTFFTDLNGFQVCSRLGRNSSCPMGGQCSGTRPCESHLWPLISVLWQIQPRRYQRKLPLQANFYPMPAMAYIQDMQSRLTLLTAQALGVSSLHSGELGSVPWGPAAELELSFSRKAGEEGAAGWAECPGPAVSGVSVLWGVADAW